MKQKYLIAFIAILLICKISYAQTPIKKDTTENLGLVKWLTISEAQEKNKQQPRPMIIDVYTDWCGWCKHMMKTTFSSPDIANYINYNFYPIRFNAETHDTLTWLGEKYVNRSPEKRSTHDLAVKLIGTRLSYPTTIFVNNNYQFMLNVPGYLEANKLAPFLIYTLENIFQSTSIYDFQKYYDLAFTPEKDKKDTLSIKWLKLQDALYKAKNENKKILFNTYTDFCNGCKVMNMAVFKDTNVVKYINKHFVAVNFNAQANDTIVCNGKLFTHSENQIFHSFPMALSGGKITLPTVYMLDADGNLILPAALFMTPHFLLAVLEYVYEDKYKTIQWKDFFSDYEKRNQKLDLTAPK